MSGLGHARLSINDLSPSGAQPFHSPDGRVHAVANGELYNEELREELKSSYTFKGTSDSEIIIAAYLAYGIDFLKKLRGEFAIVLWDEEKEFFIAARDRYGIKPLFWSLVNYNGGKRLLVAAEAKAFRPLGWEPAWDVASLVQGGWNFDDRTLFKDVRKVRPGHYLSIEKYGKMDEIRYWDMDFPDKRVLDPRGAEELIEGVRERMLDAVRVRLKADVKVGIYLSGGIDSSVLAGMTAHLVKEKGVKVGSEDPSDRVSCFSIAFDEDSGFDESDISNRTAEWLGVKYFKKHMNEAELAMRFEDATYHCEHHNHDLNYVGKYALSEVPREHDYKVVLTGEGADEVFAGYPMYLADYLREPDQNCSDQPLPEDRRETLREESENDVSKYYESIGAKSVLEPTKARAKLNNISTMASMTAFQPSILSSWATEEFGISTPQDTIAADIDPAVIEKMQKTWHPLHAGLYTWSKGHLVNQMLSCLGDRTEMAHSLEARTPFLDHHLTEYVAGIAPSWKVRWMKNEKGDDGPDGRFVEKWILREASKPFITKELYERKKHVSRVLLLAQMVLTLIITCHSLTPHQRPTPRVVPCTSCSHAF